MPYGRIAVAVTAIAAVLAAEWVWLRAQSDRTVRTELPSVTEQASGPGGGFALLDHRGRPASDESFRGEHLLMLFGYTSCPDVCPTTLASVAAAMDILGETGRSLRPLFVTLDPERDTPEVLADYVAAFHPRLVGLTGSPAQIREVAHNYRVYFAKAETGDGDYLLDHSAYVYLVGPDGRTLTYLKHDATPQAMAEAIGGFLTGRVSRSDAAAVWSAAGG